jgi:hypothetical protein
MSKSERDKLSNILADINMIIGRYLGAEIPRKTFIKSLDLKLNQIWNMTNAN